MTLCFYCFSTGWGWLMVLCPDNKTPCPTATLLMQRRLLRGAVFTFWCYGGKRTTLSGSIVLIWQTGTCCLCGCGNLVGKSGRNSAEFRDCYNFGHFQHRNFHPNFIFWIVKFIPANLEHVPASLESSPTIDSSDFMHWKMFTLFMIVASKIVTLRVASKIETQRTNS